MPQVDNIKQLYNITQLYNSSIKIYLKAFKIVYRVHFKGKFPFIFFINFLLQCLCDSQKSQFFASFFAIIVVYRCFAWLLISRQKREGKEKNRITPWANGNHSEKHRRYYHEKFSIKIWWREKAKMNIHPLSVSSLMNNYYFRCDFSIKFSQHSEYIFCRNSKSNVNKTLQ